MRRRRSLPLPATDPPAALPIPGNPTRVSYDGVAIDPVVPPPSRTAISSPSQVDEALVWAERTLNATGRPVQV